MKNQNEKLFGILNFEGDVLKLKKVDANEFVMYDQWEDIIDIFSRDGILNFLDGRTSVKDSSGKTWIWINEHHDARKPLKDILQFMLG